MAKKRPISQISDIKTREPAHKAPRCLNTQIELKRDQLLNNRYRFENVITEGSYGIVARAWDTLNHEYVALKMQYLDSPSVGAAAYAIREISTLLFLNSRHTLRAWSDATAASRQSSSSSSSSPTSLPSPSNKTKEKEEEEEEEFLMCANRERAAAGLARPSRLVVRASSPSDPARVPSLLSLWLDDDIQAPVVPILHAFTEVLEAKRGRWGCANSISTEFTLNSMQLLAAQQQQRRQTRLVSNNSTGERNDDNKEQTAETVTMHTEPKVKTIGTTAIISPTATTRRLRQLSVLVLPLALGSLEKALDVLNFGAHSNALPLGGRFPSLDEPESDRSLQMFGLTLTKYRRARHRLAMQTICGLDWMHRNRFIHRDIKPNNVLVYQRPPHKQQRPQTTQAAAAPILFRRARQQQQQQQRHQQSNEEEMETKNNKKSATLAGTDADSWTARLTDFGYAISLDNVKQNPDLSLVPWGVMRPELRAPENVCGYALYDERSDNWAMGMLLLEIYFNRIPITQSMDTPAALVAGIREKIGWPESWRSFIDPETKLETAFERSVLFAACYRREIISPSIQPRTTAAPTTTPSSGDPYPQKRGQDLAVSLLGINRYYYWLQYYGCIAAQPDRSALSSLVSNDIIAESFSSATATAAKTSHDLPAGEQRQQQQRKYIHPIVATLPLYDSFWVPLWNMLEGLLTVDPRERTRNLGSAMRRFLNIVARGNKKTTGYVVGGTTSTAVTASSSLSSSASALALTTAASSSLDLLAAYTCAGLSCATLPLRYTMQLAPLPDTQRDTYRHLKHQFPFLQNITCRFAANIWHKVFAHRKAGPEGGYLLSIACIQGVPGEIDTESFNGQQRAAILATTTPSSAATATATATIPGVDNSITIGIDEYQQWECAVVLLACMYLEDGLPITTSLRGFERSASLDSFIARHAPQAHQRIRALRNLILHCVGDDVWDGFYTLVATH